jgi:hypothetical protein
MENTKIQPTTIDHVTEDYQTKVQTRVSAQHLLDALFWIWDAFDRANVKMFLVLQTAEDAMKGRELSGRSVDIGIRRMEWVSGGRRILDSFLGDPETETNDIATYTHNDTPVTLHIYDDDDCIINLDSITYKYEQFHIPNPYSRFKKLYELPL